MNKLLGIDPGRGKTGLALVAADGAILKLAVVPTENLAVEIPAFVEGEEPTAIVMGDGTNSAAVRKIVEAEFSLLSVHIINEAHSTEEARNLYWDSNPPVGWRRLVPLGMLVPTEPLDAYAAVVLVRRFLAGVTAESERSK